MMIVVASDHGGYALRKEIVRHLREKGITAVERGSQDGETYDYPVAAAEACELVCSGEARFAVLVCGTGVGISIAANKMRGIRAAVCTDAYTAEYSRRHNDANALCLGERVTGAGAAISALESFIAADFDGGRHARRLGLIDDMENAALI